MAIKRKHGGLKDKKTSTEKRFTKRFHKNQEKLYPKTFISNHSSQNDNVIMGKSPMAKHGKLSFFVNKWFFVELGVAMCPYQICMSLEYCNTGCGVFKRGVQN